MDSSLPLRQYGLARLVIDLNPSNGDMGFAEGGPEIHTLR